MMDMGVSGDLVQAALDCMGAAVTIIDPDGVMLYYNTHATEILDRRPELIGQPIFSCHQKAASNNRVYKMLETFREGRLEPFRYQAAPLGYPIFVTLSPIHKDGRFIGCVHSVIRKSDTEAGS